MYVVHQIFAVTADLDMDRVNPKDQVRYIMVTLGQTSIILCYAEQLSSLAEFQSV